jgi:hypothetical protein
LKRFVAVGNSIITCSELAEVLRDGFDKECKAKGLESCAALSERVRAGCLKELLDAEDVSIPVTGTDIPRRLEPAA